MQSVLTVQGLRKAFPGRGGMPAAVALDGIDLTVGERSFTTVLGPSGSGKTTLLRCIAGFETPDDGVITLAGRELVAFGARGLHAHARGIGVVPQEGALFPHLSVAQNIGFGLREGSRSSRRARVASLLDLVGLPGVAQRRPHELSGGQQQRVALARALAPEPALILLDEPFAALDARLRADLRDEVRDLLRRVGATAVLVTHDQAEAMTLADHLIVIRRGRVICAGSPRNVYENPADTELGRFLGEALIIPGEIDQDGNEVYVACALGRLKVGAWHGQPGQCDVLVRPEQLAAAPLDPRRNGAATVAEVTGHSFYGPHALLRVTIEGSRLPAAVRVPGHDRNQVGDLIELQVTRPVATYPPAGRQD